MRGMAGEYKKYLIRGIKNMASYQKLIIVGNVGSEPDMRYLPSGKAVTTFSVATNRKWTNSDGSPGKETTWFRVSAWGRQAETCNEYLSKGSSVLVEGNLKPNELGNPRVWTGSDGQAKASYEITASRVTFLSSRSDTSPQEESEIPF